MKQLNNHHYMLYFKTRISVLLITAAVLCGAIPVNAQTEAGRYPLIPYPTHLVPANGDFTIDAHTKIVLQDKVFSKEAGMLRQLVAAIRHISPAATPGAGAFADKDLIDQRFRFGIFPFKQQFPDLRQICGRAGLVRILRSA